jgi:plastocyanin
LRVPKVFFGLVTFILATAILAGCGSGKASTAASTTTPGGSGTATGTTITIKSYQFHPASLTVKPGATITVHNEDSVAHTVTAVAPHKGIFNSGDIAGGSTKTITAPSAAGTYSYICSIHPFMTGALIVS